MPDDDPRLPNDYIAEMEDAQRLSPRVVWFIVLAILLFIAAVGVTSWQRDLIRGNVQAYRAERLLAKAAAFEENGDTDAARDALLRATALDPDAPEPLRQLARLDRAQSPADAATYLYLLHQLEQTTLDEDVELLKLLLDLRHYAEARAVAKSLTKRAPNDARTLRLAARTAEEAEAKSNSGAREQQADLLQKAQELDPKDRRVRLARAKTKLVSPLREVEEAGIETILDLAGSDEKDDVSLDALRFIAVNRARIPAALHPKFFALYQNHPLRRDTGALRLLEWELELHPDRANSLVPDSIRAWHTSVTPDELADRLYWLATKGKSHAAHVHAFLTETRNTTTPAFATAALAARISPEKVAPAPTPDQLDDEIRGAVGLAARVRRGQDLIRLGNIALAHDRETIASETFERAIKQSPRDAHLALAGIARRATLPDQLLGHLEPLLQLPPVDPNLKAETTYLRLLLRRNIDAAIADATALMEDYPDNPRGRLLLAFAHVRRNNIIDATILIDQIDDPEQLEPAFHPALAAIYHALGRFDAAESIYRKIKPDTLSPDEQSLIQPITRRQTR